MNKTLAISILILIIVGGGLYFILQSGVNNQEGIACTQEAKLCPDGSYVGRTGPNCEFAECPKVEDSHADLIRVQSPAPNAVVTTNSLTVKGEARGNWYFEASFPVRLYDANGKELAVKPAQAQGEWMTTNFVPFEVTLNFTKPATATGTLVLEKDNPSGLPQFDDKITIPIRFTAEQTQVISPIVKNNCVVSGCSGQICSDKEMVSTCEYRPEYACYKSGTCELQTNGQCGWTQTSTLSACLSNNQ